MLTRLRPYFSHHKQAALSSLQTLGRQPLATIMTALVIAITLTLPTLFWVLTDHMKQLTTPRQQAGHISLYLVPSLSPEENDAFLSKVKKVHGVTTATLTTPAEGLAQLQQQEGMQDILHYLPENPLPAVINVIPSFDTNSPESLEQLYQTLKSYPQVEQAKLDRQWVNRLQAILGFSAQLAKGLMLLLALAVMLIIGNTLRLAVHNRQEEIQILQLIGAKNAYIIRPFLYSGLWYGLAGALLSVLLVNGFILSLTLVANQLAAAYDMHYAPATLSLHHVLYLTSIALLLGWLGATLSVRRELSKN